MQAKASPARLSDPFCESRTSLWGTVGQGDLGIAHWLLIVAKGFNLICSTGTKIVFLIILLTFSFI